MLKFHVIVYISTNPERWVFIQRKKYHPLQVELGVLFLIYIYIFALEVDSNFFWVLIFSLESKNWLPQMSGQVRISVRWSSKYIRLDLFNWWFFVTDWDPMVNTSPWKNHHHLGKMDVRGLNGVSLQCFRLVPWRKNTKSFEFKSPKKSNHFFVDTYIMHILTKIVYMPQWRSLSLLPYYSC